MNDGIFTLHRGTAPLLVSRPTLHPALHALVQAMIDWKPHA